MVSGVNGKPRQGRRRESNPNKADLHEAVSTRQSRKKEDKWKNAQMMKQAIMQVAMEPVKAMVKAKQSQQVLPNEAMERL